MSDILHHWAKSVYEQLKDECDKRFDTMKFEGNVVEQEIQRAIFKALWMKNELNKSSEIMFRS